MKWMCRVFDHRWRVLKWRTHPRGPGQITAPVWWIVRECRRCKMLEKRENNMRVLIIDDERDFKLMQGKVERLDIARTVQEAISLMESNPPYDDIWLDHDLGGDDTIMPFVDWIAEQCWRNDYSKFYPTTRFRIHTSNPSGRDTIERALKRWQLPYEHVSASDWQEKTDGKTHD